QDLPRIRARQAEQLAEQAGLLDPVEEEDVAREGGLDQRVEDVLLPALVAADERRGTGVAAVDEIRVEVPAEGVAHLRERPVRDADDLEATGDAVRAAQ